MNMKFTSITKKIMSSIKALAVILSVWTMTFSTVALGVESESRLKEAQKFILETGLSKKTTYKEFWNNTKHIYPGEVYKSAEKFFLANPNAIMPKFSVREVANSKGEKMLAMTIDGDNGKSHQVQIVAQKEKWATFDGVELTPADFHHVEATFKKLENGLKSKNKSSNSALQKFQGYPTVDKKSWKKMTQIERAQHIVNLRVLWSGASDVLELNEKLKSVETSSLDKWNLFISFLNKEAFANKVGEACVVAGYIGSYQKGKTGLTCNYPVGEGQGSCKTPCNPIIYGYASGGQEICVPNRGQLQTATHWKGACDSASPLTIKELNYPAPKNVLRNTQDYDSVVEKNKADALSPENKAKNLKLTENYLKSMLDKNADASIRAMFEKGDFTDDVLAKLKNIENRFNAEIKQAQNICASVSDGKQKTDKKFYPACDQLHKRFLFVREYLQEKCPKDAPLNNELKCECSNKKTLNPNSQEKCEIAVVVPPVVVTPDTKPAPVEERTIQTCQQEDFKGLDVDSDCLCTKTKTAPRADVGFFSGKTKWTCDKETNWNPLLIGAGILGLGALLYFMFKKDDDDDEKKPPVVVNTCTKTCGVNESLNQSTCVCTPNWTPERCTMMYDAEFCPSEGGSGDSCPSGDCSGGVPGAVVN